MGRDEQDSAQSDQSTIATEVESSTKPLTADAPVQSVPASSSSVSSSSSGTKPEEGPSNGSGVKSPMKSSMGVSDVATSESSQLQSQGLGSQDFSEGVADSSPISSSISTLGSVPSGTSFGNFLKKDMIPTAKTEADMLIQQKEEMQQFENQFSTFQIEDPTTLPNEVQVSQQQQQSQQEPMDKSDNTLSGALTVDVSEPVSVPTKRPTVEPTHRVTEAPTVSLRDTSELPPRQAAIVVLSHNRPDNLRRTLLALASLPEAGTEFKIFVSCDNPASLEDFRRVAAESELRGLVQDVWHTAPRAGVREPLIKISDHYRFALDMGLSKNSFTHLIVTEDDLVPSPDFLTYFHHLSPLLDRDPSLWCISAWHDNGFRNLVRDEKRLFRTNFFPGLGWMIRREHWNDVLKPIWPNAPTNGWDHWIRSIAEHESLGCIAPEVPRVEHVSKSGTNIKDGGKFFSRFALSAMPSSPDKNPYGDLSYLYEPGYRHQLQVDVTAAQRISLPQYVGLSRVDFKSTDGGATELPESYLILYQREHYTKLASQLGLWPGEPRAYYDGIIRVSNTPGRPVLYLAERRDARTMLHENEAIFPDDHLTPVVAEPRKNCEVACADKGMTCVAEQLAFLNKCSVMKKYLPCEAGCSNQIGLELPAYVVERSNAYQQCLLSYSETSSCSAVHPATQRICPCVPN
mmetsp:Transcript_3233/g.7252  ORF Transcript_3233/g.7252 Transcript_3233/m.7252 type:complete len:686 (-) Transcript_3233:248-2305(-)